MLKILRCIRKYLCCWPSRGTSSSRGKKSAHGKASKLLEKSWCYSHMNGSRSFHSGVSSVDEEDMLLNRIEAKCDEYKEKKRFASEAYNILVGVESQFAFYTQDATGVLVEDLRKLCSLRRERIRTPRGNDNVAEEQSDSDTSLSISCGLVASKNHKLRNDLYRLGFELRLVLDTLNTMEERLLCIEQELLERQRYSGERLNLSTYTIHTLGTSEYPSVSEDSGSNCSSLDAILDESPSTTSNSFSIVFSENTGSV